MDCIQSMTSKRDTSRKPGSSLDGLKFALLPGWRMEYDFPWILWALGWLSIFKGVLWLSSDPVVVPLLARVLAAKFLLTMVPFVVFGIGVWNLRRWATVGLLALAVIDLLFYLVFPASITVMVGESFWGLAAVLLVFNGPAGDVLILLAAPALWKHTGRQAIARQRIENRTTRGGAISASQGGP